MAQCLMARSRYLCERGEHQKAILDINKVIERNALDYEMFCVRAVEHTHMGKLKEALADYGKVIDMEPEYTPAYERRARVFDKLGKTDLARRDRATAEKLDRKSGL
jgi:tetratricopeptide (TPR) repeat protein